jgi:hypothetical protein
MASEDRENETARGAVISARMGIGSWTLLVVLILFLGITIVASYLSWMLSNRTDMPASGYVAMTLGVVFSLCVGFGLMALIFYSSRKGYDEPPVLISSNSDSNFDSTSEKRK